MSAFPDSGRNPQLTTTTAYLDLLNSVNAAAFRLSGYLPPSTQVPGTNNGPTVAILSESSPDLLMNLFGLIKMGYTVLLIAYGFCQSNFCCLILTHIQASMRFQSRSASFGIHVCNIAHAFEFANLEKSCGRIASIRVCM